MSIVWVLDAAPKAPNWQESLAGQLIYDFPVRLFTSSQTLLASLEPTQIPSEAPPRLIIIDGVSGTQEQASILARAQQLACPCLRMVTQASATVRKAALPASDAGHGLSMVEVPRPASRAELNALLQRFMPQLQASGGEGAGLLHYGPLCFDSEQFCLHITGETASETLSLKEGRLLKFFMQQPTRCLPRALIKETVWGRVHVSPRTIDSQISRLRKRLSQHGVTIENVYGDGYIFQ